MLRVELQEVGLDPHPDLLGRLDEVIMDIAAATSSDYMIVMDAICEVVLHVQEEGEAADAH